MTFSVNSASLSLIILNTFFFYCSLSQQLISDLELLLTSALKQPSSLTQHTLLLNYTNTTGTPHIITTKLVSLIRLSLYNLRTRFPKLLVHRYPLDTVAGLHVPPKFCDASLKKRLSVRISH